MTFVLKVHLKEVAREERRSGCSLRDYAEFIKLSHEACRLLPEEMEVSEIDGPSIQIIHHNFSYIRTHFPSMSEDFATEICEEVNFKFKEVTEEMQDRMANIKEEKSMTLSRHSIGQKELIEVLKVLVQVVGMQVATVFGKESKEEQKQTTKLPDPVHDTRYQERDFWAKADEKKSRVKDFRERENLFKNAHERSEVSTQI